MILRRSPSARIWREKRRDLDYRLEVVFRHGMVMEHVVEREKSTEPVHTVLVDSDRY